MLIPVSFSSAAAQKMSNGSERAGFADQFVELGLPSAETEDWRYSPIADLPISKLAPQLEAPVSSLGDVVCPDNASAVVRVVNGWVDGIAISDAAAGNGLTIEDKPWSSERADQIDPTGLDALHAAFSPSTLVITIPANVVIDNPVEILTVHTGDNVAAFCDTVVNVGANGQVSIIERQEGTPGLGLTVASVALHVADHARLAHTTVQNVSREHWLVARHTSSTGSQATLTSGLAAFGGKYARVRTDADLAGRGANGELFAVYFGDDDQVHDFRTFQHHSARDTQSDMVFKGTLDDESGSVYTGMVYIHPSGAGSNANQTNKNIKLSDDAWAWSVPNLEIENSDVRCSHASTVSPVDAEQRFYLHARGVPPLEADKLIVAGFFHEVIQRLPSSVHNDVVELVAAKLAGKTA